MASALVVQGCSAPAGPPPPRNLIVISVDTLRADHMSLHGYPRPTTPRIDAFAQRAATFDRAIAPWPKTVPSMVSMFTSRYPHTTGIMYGSRGQYVPDAELMLAEVARANGMATSAVVANGVLGSSTNFNQGFDRYVETYTQDPPAGARDQNTADAVTAYAQLELRRLGDGPFFLWLHYVDPHARYEPPQEYAAPFFEDPHYDATPLRLNDDDGNFHGGVAGRYWRRNGGQEQLGWYVANYDGEIAYTDAQIGIMLDELEGAGLLEDTAIMITADHGESLGEHQYFFEHGWFPYHACGWIPWVVYWPGMPNAGSRVPYPTSLLNLLPTAAELMDWEVDPSRFHGASVLPVIAGDQSHVAAYVIEQAAEAGLEWDEFTRTIQDDRWKLVQVPSERYRSMMQGVEFELYDIRQDPMETNNLAAQHPEIVDRLLIQMVKLLDAAGPIASKPSAEPGYSEEELRSLRALGYIR